MKNKNFNGCFYGRQTPTDYEIKKEEARQKGIDWQLDFTKKELDWLTYANKIDELKELAKRFGLIKEFKENGII